MARTEQEVTTAIEAALRVVNEASVPDGLQALAFEKAFDALINDAPASGAAQLGGRPADDRAASGSVLARAAARLAVEQRLLERVVDVDDDGVHITAPRSRFAKQKSAAIHQVAMLIAGVRQGGGLEEWTPQALVRQATENLGVDDASNFATHMKRLEGVRLRGSGRTGEMKMNAVGFEAASKLIHQLAEETGA